MTGATGATGAAAPSSYVLMGGDQSELQRYANSRVEIIGTLEPASAPGSPSAAAPGSAGTAGSATPEASAATPQQLHITSVRQVAGTCGGGV